MLVHNHVNGHLKVTRDPGARLRREAHPHARGHGRAVRRQGALARRRRSRWSRSAWSTSAGPRRCAPPTSTPRSSAAAATQRAPSSCRLAAAARRDGTGPASAPTRTGSTTASPGCRARPRSSRSARRPTPSSRRSGTASTTRCRPPARRWPRASSPAAARRCCTPSRRWTSSTSPATTGSASRSSARRSPSRVHLIASNAGYEGDDVVKQVTDAGRRRGLRRAGGPLRQHGRDGHHRPAAGGALRPAERCLGGRPDPHHQLAGGRGADALEQGADDRVRPARRGHPAAVAGLQHPAVAGASGPAGRRHRDRPPCTTRPAGERYLVVDAQVHAWDGSPHNQAGPRRRGLRADLLRRHRELDGCRVRCRRTRSERVTEQGLNATCSARATSTARCCSRWCSATCSCSASARWPGTPRWPGWMPGRFVLSGELDPDGGQPGAPAASARGCAGSTCAGSPLCETRRPAGRMRLADPWLRRVLARCGQAGRGRRAHRRRRRRRARRRGGAGPGPRRRDARGAPAAAAAELGRAACGPGRRCRCAPAPPQRVAPARVRRRPSSGSWPRAAARSGSCSARAACPTEQLCRAGPAAQRARDAHRDPAVDRFARTSRTPSATCWPRSAPDRLLFGSGYPLVRPGRLVARARRVPVPGRAARPVPATSTPPRCARCSAATPPGSTGSGCRWPATAPVAVAGA